MFTVACLFRSISKHHFIHHLIISKEIKKKFHIKFRQLSLKKENIYIYIRETGACLHKGRVYTPTLTQNQLGKPHHLSDHCSAVC